MKIISNNRRCAIPADSSVNPDLETRADTPVDRDTCPTEPAVADLASHSGQPDPAILAATGDLLRALAAPVRISIVLELMHADLCVHQLVDLLGITQPLVSQHLRVLKSAQVVRGDRNGREIVYRLVDDHLAHIVVDAVAHATERGSR